MSEPILFERLFGTTPSTKILSHLIEFSGFEYSVEELVDILDLTDYEIRNVLNNLLE